MEQDTLWDRDPLRGILILKTKISQVCKQLSALGHEQQRILQKKIGAAAGGGGGFGGGGGGGGVWGGGRQGYIQK